MKDPKWKNGPLEEEHDDRCPSHEDNDGESSQECECAELAECDADDLYDRWRDDRMIDSIP